MAIINSMGVGRSRKSAGNMTYRTVRGRTIGSQKITPKVLTRALTVAEISTRTLFGLISRYADMHKNSIAVSFNKSKYGSQRNYFFKVNYPGLKLAFADLDETASDKEIDDAAKTYATSNATAIYRVKREGYTTKYLGATGWVSTDDPEEAGGDDGGEDGGDPLG